MVTTGSVALPEFQRDFVWDPSQVVELLESVASGWPIGALLLLEGPQQFRVRRLKDGPPVDKGSVRFHLLDGQQRITALFHALTDTGDTVYFVDFAKVDEFDPTPQIRWAPRRRYVPDAAASFTIRELTNDSLFFARTAHLSSADERRLREQRDSVIGYLADGYRLSTIVMRNDIDLEALTRIFETLNRTGVNLNAFDLMVAVLYPHKFHLKDRWEEAEEQFPRFRLLGVDGLEILKVIALWEWWDQRSSPKPASARSVTGVRQRDVLALKPTAVVERWDDATIAYDRALAFLIEYCGVRAGGVPSWAMVLSLTFMLSIDQDEHAIMRWYWRAIVRQSYAQGANTQVLYDAAHATDLVDDKSINYRPLLEASLSEPIRRSRILRLGLRGAAVIGGAYDATEPSERLRDSVIDVSSEEAVRGRLVAPPSTLVRDLLMVAASRSGSRRGPSQGVLLDSAGLESQGFSIGLDGIETTTARRVAVIGEWIGEWL